MPNFLSIQSNRSLINDCPHFPIGWCHLPLGKPALHRALTLANIYKTRHNNFCIRLLTGSDGLEADTSRFRQHQNKTIPLANCVEPPWEDSLYFVASCPTLLGCRIELIGEAPSSVKDALPDPARDLHCFFDVRMGVNWIHDSDIQLFCIDFLDSL